MMTQASIAKVIERLETLSRRKVRSDKPNFNPMDASGGNFDDAFEYGREDGETLLAKELFALLMDNQQKDVVGNQQTVPASGA